MDIGISKRKLNGQVDRFAQARRSMPSDIDLSDPEIAEMVIESETDLVELGDHILQEITEAECHLLALAAQKDLIASRENIFTSRIEKRKQFLLSMLRRTGLTFIRLALGTPAISPGKARVDIIDESLVPPQYFVAVPPPEPRIDKRALSDALKDGPVDGARIVFGDDVLTIRRK